MTSLELSILRLLSTFRSLTIKSMSIELGVPISSLCPAISNLAQHQFLVKVTWKTKYTLTHRNFWTLNPDRKTEILGLLPKGK